VDKEQIPEWDNPDENIRIKLVEKMTSIDNLSQIAKSDPSWDVRNAARLTIERIENSKKCKI